MVSIIDIKRMERKRDIEGLLKCSVITYSDSWLDYETDHDRELKEHAFRFIVDEIGYEAINSLINLFNDPDVDIRLRAVECLGEIGKSMQEEAHGKLIQKCDDSFGFIDFLQSSDSDCSYEIYRISKNVWDNIKYGSSNFEQLMEHLDLLVYTLRDSKFGEDVKIYEEALCNIKKVYAGLKRYNKLFSQAHKALNKIISDDNNQDVNEAAKEAILYLSLLPISDLKSRNDCEDPNTTPKQCLVSNSTKKTSFYERNRSLNKRLIDENDAYMDDLISSLYAARIEFLKPEDK